MTFGGPNYDTLQWRLFIDSNKSSLKAVSLHNWNQYASLPMAHSVTLKEKYDDLALILKKIKYEDHGWMICGDLKVISTLLDQQQSYTKYPCFLCMWDSFISISNHIIAIGKPYIYINPVLSVF